MRILPTHPSKAELGIKAERHKVEVGEILAAQDSRRCVMVQLVAEPDCGSCTRPNLFPASREPSQRTVQLRTQRQQNLSFWIERLSLGRHLMHRCDHAIEVLTGWIEAHEAAPGTFSV